MPPSTCAWPSPAASTTKTIAIKFLCSSTIDIFNLQKSPLISGLLLCIGLGCFTHWQPAAAGFAQWQQAWPTAAGRWRRKARPRPRPPYRQCIAVDDTRAISHAVHHDAPRQNGRVLALIKVYGVHWAAATFAGAHGVPLRLVLIGRLRLFHSAIGCDGQAHWSWHAVVGSVHLVSGAEAVKKARGVNAERPRLRFPARGGCCMAMPGPWF